MAVYEQFNIKLHTQEPVDWRLDHILCWIERHDGYLYCEDHNQIYLDGVQKKEGAKTEELCRELQEHILFLLPFEVRCRIAPLAASEKRMGKGDDRTEGGEF